MKIGILKGINPIPDFILIKKIIGIVRCIERNQLRENFLVLLLQIPKGIFNKNIKREIKNILRFKFIIELYYFLILFSRC
ncbi:MAG: hypothetical protein ABIN23_05790 [candidate division WOR-3 bacterium]